MARLDPHSFADLDQGATRALHLALEVDFTERRLRGTATLQLADPATGPLDLDTRELEIHSVTDSAGAPLRFELGEPDPILGTRLRVHRPTPIAEIVLRYTTGATASGLMWLDPAQTDGGRHPFVLTQCQAIHARSITPVQDTPRARITYSARVVVPAGLSAVMSAAPGDAEPLSDGRSATRFEMPQPIPPYLLALAVGELTSRDLGPRTRVWAEPGVIDAAAWEFEAVEHMLGAGEALFGPYPWDRYDFIVLPPSFPLGGMENPRMTFLTPTLIAGDRSLVSVLAHELAHSWTGNLVTNATNEDFWLNEGWTVYAERRILEALEGAAAAAEDAVLGRIGLDETLTERAADGQRTALCYPQQGVDPDEDFSKLPYEKGFLLITALERAAGRPVFDAFVKRYLDAFRFRSITTAEFAAFVRRELPEAALVDLETWLYTDGLPDDAPTFDAPQLDALRTLAHGWATGARPDDDPTAWTTTAKLVLLASLPHDLDAASAIAAADALGLHDTGNAELESAWLALAARAGVPGIEPELVAFLDRVGRTKLLRPVVAAMASRPALRALAIERFRANHARLHASTRGALASALSLPVEA